MATPKKASTRARPDIPEFPTQLPAEPPHPEQLPVPPDKPPKPDNPHPGKPGKDKAGAHGGRPGRERQAQAGLQEQHVVATPRVMPAIYPGQLYVRAMKLGFFDNILRRPGDEFVIPAATYSGTWMLILSYDDTPI